MLIGILFVSLHVLIACFSIIAMILTTYVDWHFV